MKNRDFFDEEFSPFEEGEGIDAEQMLPELYGIGGSEELKKGRLKAWQLALALITSLTATALVLVIILMATGSRGDEPEAPAFSEDKGEWRGAFLSKEIYENALTCSVTLRGGEREWSGVMISEDGWIATALDPVEETERGRIYAVLGDGREYGVESFFGLGDTAALKIDAEGLSAPAVSSAELQAGESVISVSAGGELFCGFLSGVDSQSFNIPLTDRGEGAPVFDREGGLVGVAEATKSASVWECSSDNILAIIAKIKNKGQNK
jgi:hypothetical protein